MLKMMSGVLSWPLGARASKTQANAEWRNPREVMPNRDVPIEWMDSSGNVVCGKFLGVWMMDSGMYVYYTPTLWRYA